MQTVPSVMLVFALVFNPLVSVTASAQSPDLLSGRAEPGDRITVTTTAGAEVRGKLRSDMLGTLVLETGEGDRRFSYGEIDRASRYRNRILWGPLIGLAAGLAVGLPLAKYAENEAKGEAGKRALVGIVGIGVGIGTLIDAFNGNSKTVYRRGGASANAIAVEATRGGGAVRWGISW